MTTASVQGVKVNLPKASTSVSLAKPQTKAITVSDSGQIFLDAFPVSLSELEQRLRTQKAVTPDFPVIVKGDSNVQYQKVVDILDLLRRLDLSQVGLVTGKQQG
jgi:biopolymer transport protein ExbD